MLVKDETSTLTVQHNGFGIFTACKEQCVQKSQLLIIKVRSTRKYLNSATKEFQSTNKNPTRMFYVQVKHKLPLECQRGESKRRVCNIHCHVSIVDI